MHTLMFKQSAINHGGLNRANCLVVYYSLTGMTRIVAQQIASIGNCDVEEIVDVRPRRGMFGYLRSGFEAVAKIQPKIRPSGKNPASYDLVVLGTPVWMGRMSTPMRAYITKNRNCFRHIATFCTMGQSGGKEVSADIEALCGKAAVARLELSEKDIQNRQYLAHIASFVIAMANHGI
jgi:flavodoxin